MMKSNFYALVLVLMTGMSGFAQCEVFSTVFVSSPALCAGDPMLLMGIATTNCPMPYSVNYLWEVNVEDGSGNPVVSPEYSQSGTAPSVTSIPVFELNDVPGLISVCLTTTLLDPNLLPLSSSQNCFTGIQFPAPMTVSVQTANDMCGNQNCLSNVAVTGGTAPFSYELSNGQTLTPNFWTCFDEPGVYEVLVIDDNGCSGIGSFLIDESEMNNGTCAQAVELIDGVIETDTLCEINFQDTSCAGFSYYLSGWYYINSENYTHMNIAFGSSYYNYLYNFPFALEVYQEVTAGDCSQNELVFCYQNTDGGNCFDLADQVALQPNTNYYIRVTVQWTSIMYCELLVDLSDEPIPALCGCTDPNSCNYDPQAQVNDNSCGYSGCMDPGACNYLSYATCDDGSCIFGSDLTGLVFHDLNGDGVYGSYPVQELVLGNTGYLHIEELDVLVYPDASGSFVLPDLASGVYHITYNDPSGAWILSVASPLIMTLPTCTGLLIPLIPASEVSAQLNGAGFFNNMTMHCTNGFYPGLWIQNTGNVNINGTLVLNMDASLTLSDYLWGEPYDSFENGVVQWTINNLAPGQIGYYYVHVNGPGAALVGTVYPFSMSLELTDDSFVPFYENDWSFNATVTCAYDPNDKQANPEGYTSEHYILADDVIEYKIRFQNTGNAPAFDVRIEDQLDITKLDIATFEPAGASHSYSTILQPDGLVNFVFNNIMLPDSGSDEAGSHGWVVYRIAPRADVIPGDVIENTADIYFDDNPAIVTNTTYHTIYSCDMIQGLSEEEQICAGLSFVYDVSDFAVESYTWLVNGEYYSDESMFIYESEIPADLDVTLIRTNPLCTVEDSFIFHNLAVPGTEIQENGFVLTAPEGAQWQWFLNGNPIDGATSQTFEAIQEGTYTVNTINENDCVITSESLNLVGVVESSINDVNMFPNPVSDVSRLILPSGIFEVRIYNVLGESMYAQHQVRHGMNINKSDYGSGIYFIEIENAQHEKRTIRFVVK